MLMWQYSNSGFSLSGPVVESKGLGAIFQETVKKHWKIAKYLKLWGEMYKIGKYFEKGYVN